MNDFFFDLAEREYLDPNLDPQRCPICGSIDVSAGGICRHCGSNIKLEVEIDELQDPEETPRPRTA